MTVHGQTFTFHIFSARRDKLADASSDYYVTLPYLSVIANSAQNRCQYYELTLNRLSGLDNGTDFSPANQHTGFIQLALDFPAPFLVTNGAHQNVLFIVPLSDSMATQNTEGSYFQTSPVIIAGSGLRPTIHVQLYDDSGAVLNVAGPNDHVITMTLREILP